MDSDDRTYTVPTFDLSSQDAFPWNEDVIQETLERRDQLEGRLFFDDLLSFAGIDYDALYPPRDATSFLRLVKAIEESEWDRLKRDCLLFYLAMWWRSGIENEFRKKRRIPPHFARLSQAFFCFDTGDVQTAVNLLCDPRITPTDTGKILRAISMVANTSALVVRYVRMAKPILTEPEEIDIYIVALCDASLTDAWLYQRGVPEGEDRRRIMSKILGYCLTPKPKSRALTALLSFSLTSSEESFLQECAISRSLPPLSIALVEPALSTLQDLITVRLIHQGKYSEAIKLDKEFVNAGAHENSSSTAEGRLATHKAQTRREMLKEVLSALPSVQRRLLETELGFGVPAAPRVNGAAPQPIDMEMSWEDVSRSNASVDSAKAGAPSDFNRNVFPYKRPDAPASTFASLAASTRSRTSGTSTPTRPAMANVFVPPSTITPIAQRQPGLQSRPQNSPRTFPAPTDSPRPNAFFNPAALAASTSSIPALAVTPVKRQLDQHTSKPSLDFGKRRVSDVDMEPSQPSQEDVVMGADDDDADDFVIEGAKPYKPVPMPPVQQKPKEPSPPPPPARRKVSTRRQTSEEPPPPPASPPPSKKLPPGAFPSDSDPEDAPVSTVPPSRTTRSSKALQAVSIPEDEAVDVPSAPAPSTKTRKSTRTATARTRKGKTAEAEAEAEAPAPRRSSRLSHALSDDEAPPPSQPKTPRASKKKVAPTPARVMPRRERRGVVDG